MKRKSSLGGLDRIERIAGSQADSHGLLINLPPHRSQIWDGICTGWLSNAPQADRPNKTMFNGEKGTRFELWLNDAVDIARTRTGE
jgi:hypothetical protein